MKYRKKPVVIDAMQWDNDAGTLKQFQREFGIEFYEVVSCEIDDDGRRSFHIKTLEGNMELSIGDYIIRGLKGEYYPCKPDIFEMSYEKALPSA